MTLHFSWAAALAGALLAGCSPARIVNGLVPSSSYRSEAGLAYGPQPRQRLDVYRPLADRPPADGQRPLVVFFYGGNWTTGERADYRFVGEALAARGAVVVIPDYRLSPQATYPAFVSDSARATRWGIDNAARLGADPRQVFVMGHSAGAYLAAMVALDARWLRADGGDPSQLAGWIGLAGPYDFLPIGDPRTQAAFEWPQTAPSSQPLAHASAASPPALLMVAAHDRLVDPARNTGRMAERLRAAGVKVEVREFGDLDHVTLIGAIAKPLEWIGGPVLPPLLAFIGLTPEPPGSGAQPASRRAPR
ncbi:alpha/beta hydrolase [Variovorax sp. J22P271]|uniref:alpha/beta hydrolase n=1 Tax=Variovorax davisae TaxID=3053515 RepID=UPI002574F903|nr:alpha/beta hydrolase [Variovorax sp. J22P271]MDM0035226.1 alpha/beta hydrolase [Variovorax sp. J22P271]